MAGFTFIDLLSGIGSRRIGFEKAGGRCVFACEKNRDARKVYYENFKQIPVVDVLEVGIGDISDHDVLVSLLPIYPASGRVEPLFEAYQRVLSILEEKKPGAFLFEGSPGLLNTGLYKGLKDRLNQAGYKISEDVVDSSFFVPYRSRRLYTVGVCDGPGFKFPEVNQEAPLLGSILEQDVESNYVLPDEEVRKIKERIQEKAASSSQWNGYRIFGPDEVLDVPITVSNYRRILVALDGGGLRRFTPREFARLRGFPESFKITVPDRVAYDLIARSSIVPVIEGIAKDLAEHLVANIEQTTPISPRTSSDLESLRSHLEDFIPIRGKTESFNEKQLEDQLYQYLSAIYGKDRVGYQVTSRSGRVDIVLDDKYAVELKVIRGPNLIMIIGQIIKYSKEYTWVLLLMYDKYGKLKPSNIKEFEETMRQASVKNLDILIKG
jgi:DNA (cytosine-5)-methyltransferase 1